MENRLNEENQEISLVKATDKKALIVLAEHTVRMEKMIRKIRKRQEMREAKEKRIFRPDTFVFSAIRGLFMGFAVVIALWIMNSYN
jgi:hypothetical protein